MYDKPMKLEHARPLVDSLGLLFNRRFYCGFRETPTNFTLTFMTEDKCEPWEYEWAFYQPETGLTNVSYSHVVKILCYNFCLHMLE